MIEVYIIDDQCITESSDMCCSTALGLSQFMTVLQVGERRSERDREREHIQKHPITLQDSDIKFPLKTTALCRLQQNLDLLMTVGLGVTESNGFVTINVL